MVERWVFGREYCGDASDKQDGMYAKEDMKVGWLEVNRRDDNGVSGVELQRRGKLVDLLCELDGVKGATRWEIRGRVEQYTTGRVAEPVGNEQSSQ